MSLQDRVNKISDILPKNKVKDVVSQLYKKDLREKYREYRHKQTEISTIINKIMKKTQ